MFAMALTQPRTPLVPEDRPLPEPGAGELRLSVQACGVCRTDLHVVDGELPMRRPGVIPGHEIVGAVEAVGPGVPENLLGQRLGAGWLGRTCGHCRYCRSAEENLCDDPGFNGWTLDGG
jgi:propanol-preferring alcohol dehydrogenase